MRPYWDPTICCVATHWNINTGQRRLNIDSQPHWATNQYTHVFIYQMPINTCACTCLSSLKGGNTDAAYCRSINTWKDFNGTVMRQVNKTQGMERNRHQEWLEKSHIGNDNKIPSGFDVLLGNATQQRGLCFVCVYPSYTNLAFSLRWSQTFVHVCRVKGIRNTQQTYQYSPAFHHIWLINNAFWATDWFSNRFSRHPITKASEWPSTLAAKRCHVYDN